MERISGKKGKRRVSTNKVAYFAAIIAILILIVLISINYTQKSKNGVIIGKINFEHIGNEVYIKFDINNPTDKPKTCSLDISFADKKYTGFININAKSEKSYKTLVDMPEGKTNVRLDYICE